MSIKHVHFAIVGESVGGYLCMSYVDNKPKCPEESLYVEINQPYPTEGNYVLSCDLEWVLSESIFNPHQELLWRDNVLTKVISRIDQYERERDYPINLHTSPIKSSEDYHLLLTIRKSLCDYPNEFNQLKPERPDLSGVSYLL